MATQRVVQKDGVPSLHELATQLCRILSVFGPIIRQKYALNVPLMTALTAAEGMCALLPDALFDVLNVTSDDSDIVADPSSIPGINPAAPAYDPEPPEEP